MSNGNIFKKNDSKNTLSQKQIGFCHSKKYWKSGKLWYMRHSDTSTENMEWNMFWLKSESWKIIYCDVFAKISSPFFFSKYVLL
jgi:hypothetical protein